MNGSIAAPSARSGIPLASDISSASSSESSLVVARRVAEDDAPGDPPEGVVARRPSRARRRRALDLVEQRRGLLRGDGRRSGRRAGAAAAGVEHRLGEARGGSAHSSPREIVSASGWKCDHPVALGLGVGGERVGRALEHAAHVGGRRAAAAPGRVITRTQTGPGAVAAAHAARSGRPPGRRRSAASPPRPRARRRRKRPWTALGTITERVEAHVLEQRGARHRRRSARLSRAVRQGANAFSTPSSAGASSGWWRSRTSTIVLPSTQSRPSGV